MGGFQMKSRKIWYYEQYRKTDNQGVDHYTPILTTDIAEARFQTECRMATLDDLVDHCCGTGGVFKGIVEVAEGFFLWQEVEDDGEYKQLHIRQVASLTQNLEI
jgi:hypothetical protein